MHDNARNRQSTSSSKLNFLGCRLEEHYKYLWSEMLFIPLPIYLDNEEGREENRMRVTWPYRRWGKYAEGESVLSGWIKGSAKRSSVKEKGGALLNLQTNASILATTL
mmetsp:Transcript_14973/g.21269  ORF Transcript_14973/g.21269 Transcript_14973/m.21269 type:complete len:108 (-) Transcript_14973:491-814(-)